MLLIQTRLQPYKLWKQWCYQIRNVSVWITIPCRDSVQSLMNGILVTLCIQAQPMDLRRQKIVQDKHNRFWTAFQVQFLWRVIQHHYKQSHQNLTEKNWVWSNQWIYSTIKAVVLYQVWKSNTKFLNEFKQSFTLSAGLFQNYFCSCHGNNTYKHYHKIIKLCLNQAEKF